LGSERVERKLAAILAADVAGYSRLAGVDEERTLARLRALRGDLIDPAIAAHHGRIVKRTGDGLLIEFRSVVDAIRGAMEVQNGMAERNAGLPPERRIEFRVGVHVGDVIEEADGDLMGDGVNIAARLEGIADPGGICLSRAAYEQARGKIDLPARDLGEQRLKNIAEPVRAFAVDLGASPPAAARSLGARRAVVAAAILVILAAAGAGTWAWRFGAALAPDSSRPGPAATSAAPRFSIVVLPFANLSGDPEQQYLADVLTENLTTALARIHGAFVIARSTAFTYKGKPIDVKQIGKDLGVRYALEGSEQHSRDKVRVSAQLIDVASGADLWADQFDAERSDLFRMEDRIVARIARALQMQLIAADVARATRSRPNNPDAEDLGLRCQAAVFNNRSNFASFGNVAALCERSLQADEHDVRALNVLARILALSVITAQSVDRQADLEKADELISRALALDPDSDIAHNTKSWVLMGRNRSEQAIDEAERALALNPSDVDAYLFACAAYNYLSRPDRALELADEAIRLSPRDPFLPVFYYYKGWAFFIKQQYEPAIEWLRRAEHSNPFTDLLLASALALTGHPTEAKETLEHYRSYPRVTATTIAQLRVQQFALANNPDFIAYNERLFDGLRKAGMPEN
jgi:TolB-like protein/class 3 adenylate cyclase